MKTPRFLPSCLLAPVFVLVACHADAALFSWSAPTNIVGDTDVLTAGSVVGAFNVGDGGVTSASVNGVTFNPFAVDSTGGPVNNVSVGNFNLSTPDFFFSDNLLYGSASSPFSGLSASYQTLLRSATSVSNFVINPATFDLNISSLTFGNQYKFQWFASASGPGIRSTCAQ